MDKLEHDLLEGAKLGIEVSQLIENSKEEPTVNDAEQLYSKIPNILENVKEIHSSFFELCREASVISKSAFIEEVRKTDPQSYDVLSFIGKCYHDGKISIQDLPMLISLYGPHGRGSRKIRKKTDEKLDEFRPVLEKVDRISKKLPPPMIRTTRNRLLRSLNALAKQKDSIEKLDDETVDQLLEQSPDWMRSMNKVVERARINFQEQMKRKGFRIPSKKSVSNLNEWPPR